MNVEGSFVFYAEKNNFIEQLQNPIKFRRNNAGGSQSTTYGCDATLLIDICTAIIDANRAGVYPNDNPQILNSILYNFKCIPLLKKSQPYFRKQDWRV
mgnify:FL=1